jgi:hypothetical protein
MNVGHAKVRANPDQGYGEHLRSWIIRSDPEDPFENEVDMDSSPPQEILHSSSSSESLRVENQVRADLKKCVFSPKGLSVWFLEATVTLLGSTAID